MQLGGINFTVRAQHLFIRADAHDLANDVAVLAHLEQFALQGNLCFNRPDINPDYTKTLIFAAAAERYAVLPDLTPVHDMEALRERLETGPVSDSNLRELLAKAVKAIRIGGQDYIELELTNGTMIGKEQTT